MPLRLRITLGVLTVAFAASACAKSGMEATPPPPTSGGMPAPLCVTRDPGPSPLRRLTRAEYGRTLRDLLAPAVVDASSLPPDERAAGFDNNADVLGTSDLLVEQSIAVAEKAAAAVTADLPRFVPCAAATPDAACADRFIRDFGRRAWRRPVAPDEAAALAAVHAAGAAEAGFAEGIGRVVEVLLASPQFVYRL